MQNNPVPWRLSKSRRICLCVWAQNHHLGTAPAGFKVFHIQAVEGRPIFITLFIFYIAVSWSAPQSGYKE